MGYLPSSCLPVVYERGFRSGVQSGLYSKFESLYVDAFNRRKPGDYSGDCHRAAFPHDAKLGNGFNHWSGLDPSHALSHVGNERKE